MIDQTTSTGATSYYASSALSGGTTYYWEVHALTPGANSVYGTWSTISSFTVAAAVPSVSSISPSPVPGLNGAQTLTINGQNFVSGATVTYYDSVNNQTYSNNPTSFVNSSQIKDTAFDNGGDAGYWTVTVVNPSGGGSSTPFVFTVN